MQSSMTSISTGFPRLREALPEWWPVLTGLAVLYVPTFYGLLNGLWATEEQAHGPIILALSIWLLYRKWPEVMKTNVGKLSSVFGWIIFAIAILFYVVGRTQQIHLLEIGSFIWMLAAILLVKRGGGALKQLWFPLFFMLFMIPLPGTLVIMLTMPMKLAVSYATEHVLYWANYPIARNGVILQIGQYQLLVADACAGLQTLLTLEALGLFYLNIVRHPSVFRNATLAVLIVPISFVANVLRVMALTLITYYFGDAAGQGFLHWFAGIVLFMSALILILGLDTLLQYMVRARSEKISP